MQGESPMSADDRPDLANLKTAIRALKRARKNLTCQPLENGDLTALLDRLDKLIASTMRTLEMVLLECPQKLPCRPPDTGRRQTVRRKYQPPVSRNWH
jgi:hypothetical protein